MKSRKTKSTPLIHFRSWSRKKHAAFASMKRVIKICTLCIAYSIVAIPGKAKAQNNNGDSLQAKNYELDDVVVTAERTPVEAKQAARIVQVITRSEIERAPAQNLNDLLRYIAGADIRQRGPLGAQADISLRGGSYEQTLILLNGVNINDPQTGHHNLDLPVDLESIERIEILEGAAAISSGTNAYNGVINIITGNGRKNHLRASCTYGQYGYNRESLNASNTIGKKFHHFASYSRSESNGYITNTDFSNTNFFYQADYSSKAGKLDFQTGYSTKDFGANNFYSFKYPTQFEKTKTEFASLKFQSNSKIKIEPTLYLRRHKDHFELNRGNDTVFPFNNHMTYTAGLNLNIWTAWKFGTTSIGTDLRNEFILSNKLGDPLNVPVAVSGYNNTFYTKDYNRFLNSYFISHSATIKKMTLNAGVMLHNNTDLHTLKYYPGLDIAYRLIPGLKVFASLNKSMRMPTFTDMFYMGPDMKGNPNLKPEEAISLESGINYRKENLSATISGFRRWGKNTIDWVKNPDSTFYYSKNYTKINYSGCQLLIALYNPAIGNFRNIQSLRFSYTFLVADSSHSKMESRYALDYLKQQATLNADMKIAGSFFTSLRLTYQQRNGHYSNPTSPYITYNPVWLADARIYWKNKYFTIYTEASNLFNIKYFDYGGIVQPGIWVRAGIIFDFDYP